MYYVATFYPEVKTKVTEDYKLKNAELAQIVSKIVGVPITVQHMNIQRTADNIVIDEQMNPASMQKLVTASAGSVLAAWINKDGSAQSIFEIDDNFKGVNKMIKDGHLGAVSLTHVKQKNLPLELSLCSVPARQNCRINFVTDSYKKAVKYKADRELRQLNKAVMAAKLSAIEQILEALKPDEKALVEARFKQMIDAVDQARANEKDTKDKLENLTKITDADKLMLQEQLQHLFDQLDPKAKEIYSIGTKATWDVLKEAPPAVMQTMQNVIKCASHHMAMQRSQVTVTAASKKRQRQEENQQQQQQQEQVQVNEQVEEKMQTAKEEIQMDHLSPLQRAMANQFN